MPCNDSYNSPPPEDEWDAAYRPGGIVVTRLVEDGDGSDQDEESAGDLTPDF